MHCIAHTQTVNRGTLFYSIRERAVVQTMDHSSTENRKCTTCLHTRAVLWKSSRKSRVRASSRAIFPRPCISVD